MSLGRMRNRGAVSRPNNTNLRDMAKHWKIEPASHCCTADVCLRQSVNQLYNNQKITKLVLFFTAWTWLASSELILQNL